MPGLQDVTDIRQSLTGIVEQTNLISVTITPALNNGDVLKSILTVTNSGNVRILGVADWTYYIGSVAANNAIPMGSGVDMSQWQYIPPNPDWGLTDNINLKICAYLRNISAGTQTILERIRVRVIANTITRTGTAA